MVVTISERAKKILRTLAAGDALSRAAIAQAVNETRTNTIRALNRLVEQELVVCSELLRCLSLPPTPVMVQLGAR
jgi:DNA-binding IclR family transcriptional regulator